MNEADVKIWSMIDDDLDIVAARYEEHLRAEGYRILERWPAMSNPNVYFYTVCPKDENAFMGSLKRFKFTVELSEPHSVVSEEIPCEDYLQRHAHLMRS